MRKQMNLNIVIYVNNIILYLFIMQFVLQASGNSLDCTFDEDLCDWNQEDSDQFNWTREYGNTTSYSTGPISDHTRGDLKGYYIYTEASYPRQNGDKTRLISPIQEPGPNCLVIWYNMYGQDIGTLNVYIVPNYTVIFTKSGNIGDRYWRNEAISYNASVKYQIVLEGIIGQDTKGDIAVDDMSMTSELCAIDCKNPAPEHGKTNSTIFQYDSKIEISCNSGYLINGKQVIVCQKGGIWSSSPTCEPVECGNPTPKQGGVNSTHFYYGSVIEITCHVGYNISGRSVISCQADGTWTGSPTCSIIECGNPTPKHGKANSANFHHGSVIEITCNVGYNISGSAVIYCQADGIWTVFPTCNLIDCGIWKIANGYFSAVSGTTYGQTATQSCKVGYILTGVAMLTCVENGWNSSVANCTNVVLQIHVTCDVGYTVSGNPTITSQGDGTYIPTCNPVDELKYYNKNIKDCGTRKIANGEFIAVSGTTFGQTAIQSCKSGYTFIGDTVVTCTLSGWNATAATCKIVDSGNTSALIAVYVVVSVVATAVCIMLLAIIWRKCISRDGEKEQAIPGSQKTDTRTINLSNVEALQSNPGSTYTDLINDSYVNAIQSQEHEYSSIKTDGNDKRTDEKSVYYNTVETLVSQQ